MYARGILFGKMKYELGDHSYVRCPENNLVADIEFKTKGYFSGTYNAIGGTIKNEKTGEVLYELSGLWNGEMHIKDVHVRSLTSFYYLTLAANELDRLIKRRFYSMPHTQGTRSLSHAPSVSKQSASRNGYGNPRSRRSSRKTTRPRRMRKARSKIANEKRLPSVLTKVLSGGPDCSGLYTAAPAAKTRARKTWTGSSMPKCMFHRAYMGDSIMANVLKPTAIHMTPRPPSNKF